MYMYVCQISFFNNYLLISFIFQFLAVLDLHFYMGLSLVAVHGLLIVVASPVANELKGTETSVVVPHELSSCGSWALECSLNSCGSQDQLLCSMWDLSRKGITPVSPALIGRFFTTEPEGRPIKYPSLMIVLNCIFINRVWENSLNILLMTLTFVS